ncbi:MAG: methyltransferase [Planctomycetota bacterium]
MNDPTSHSNPSPSEMSDSLTNPMESGGPLGLGDPRAKLRLEPKTEEKRLMEIALDFLNQESRRSDRVAAMSTGRGQAAEAVARQSANAPVLLWYIDLFHCERAIQHTRLQRIHDPAIGGETTLEVDPPSNLRIECMADLPEQEFDVGLLPLITSGEEELARDFLQQFYDRLTVGGTLIVSVDNPTDRWLHEQLKVYEKSVRVRPFADGIVYLIEKTKPLKKRKDYSCELAFRDCDELIRLVTRPGVFSHRQLDNGARQLLDAVDVYPQAKLIDIGCGSGSVALGLAMRDPTAEIHAVDSNARALWCVQKGKELNKLSNITTQLSADGIYGEPGRFDMALANPPYFGDFQIAEKFLTAAHRSLRSGGRLVLVTKQPAWYEENMPRWFCDSEAFPSRRYHIVSGVK